MLSRQLGSCNLWCVMSKNYYFFSCSFGRVHVYVHLCVRMNRKRKITVYSKSDLIVQQRIKWKKMNNSDVKIGLRVFCCVVHSCKRWTRSKWVRTCFTSLSSMKSSSIILMKYSVKYSDRTPIMVKPYELPFLIQSLSNWTAAFFFLLLSRFSRSVFVFCFSLLPINKCCRSAFNRLNRSVELFRNSVIHPNRLFYLDFTFCLESFSFPCNF